MPVITRASLTEAFQMGDVAGTPAQKADEILARVRDDVARGCCSDCHQDHDDDDPCPEPDMELAVLGRVVHDLETLAGESGAGIDSTLRVLTFVAGRYGYALLPKD